MHSKATHNHAASPVDQVVGDLEAGIRAIGKHGRITLVVEALGEEGTLVHRVERSRMTEDEWEALMRQKPKGWRR